MIPTPDTAHIRRDEYKDSVYDPAEDTFALLDALENDADEIRAYAPRLCVEIGSGSGCVSAFVGQLLGGNAEPILTSILDALNPRIEGLVDLLLFNPPYVVTSDEEERLAQSTAGLGGSWAGGVHGTQLLDKMIHMGLIERVLSPGGRFYVVAIRANNPPALVAALQARGLQVEGSS
ncbi:peptide chain release factor N(5)-glutamine methyltransferase [Malassezia nana]|uniref:Peptide chain release factor N(5)-glutamine methyltransferase n=1 Tax=Malassezia nana TaxID=180528 RepID=A0AAF0EI73_9BASI|nr:peptide chain release factor N(5)-glutamine methyltransferase [Malassezia nana]